MQKEEKTVIAERKRIADSVRPAAAEADPHEGSILKNFSLTFMVNGLGFVVSALMTLILPALVRPELYGYWQLYLLYSGYTFYFAFGITDGAYLRYGGKRYSELDYGQVRGQFFILIVMNLLFDAALLLFYFLAVGEEMKRYAFVAACVAGLICVPRSLILMVMLATNRIRENAYAVLIERIGNICGILLLLISPQKRVEFLVACDLFGKALSLLFVVGRGRDLFSAGLPPLGDLIRETWENMRAGLSILIAALAVVFSVSIVRLVIEQAYGIEVFAKVSFSLSLSNMFTIFINAVAIVLFPTLKRMSRERCKALYEQLGLLFLVLMGFCLFFYEPLRAILSRFLSAYKDGLLYLGLLFPFFLFDGKMLFLLTTYFKVFRKEKVLLVINLLTLLFAYTLSTLAVSVFRDLTFAVLVLLFVQAFRCITAELYLARHLRLGLRLDLLVELYLSAAFLAATQLFGGLRGMAFYLLMYALFVFSVRKRLGRALAELLPERLRCRIGCLQKKKSLRE